MISNSLMETIHRGLIDFRERSSTQPLGFFPLGFPAPGSKGCWVGGKTHHTHKHLILRVGKAAKFVHIRRPKTLTFCKKALSLTWWMRCLRAMNVARKCYTKWRVGSQRQKRQPEGFCSHFGEELGRGEAVRTDRKEHFENISKVTVETYRSRSVHLGYEIKTCLPSEMDSWNDLWVTQILPPSPSQGENCFVLFNKSNKSELWPLKSALIPQRWELSLQ